MNKRPYPSLTHSFPSCQAPFWDPVAPFRRPRPLAVNWWPSFALGTGPLPVASITPAQGPSGRLAPLAHAICAQSDIHSHAPGPLALLPYPTEMSRSLRLVLVSGAIDRNGYTLVLRVPVPSVGEWTLIKAETNLTDEPWLAWQMKLGDGVSVPTTPDGSPEFLVSPSFARAVYLPRARAVVFHDGEIRPGEPILKMAHLHTSVRQICLSHSRSTPLNRHEIPRMVEHGDFGADAPAIEVVAAVRRPVVDLPGGVLATTLALR